MQATGSLMHATCFSYLIMTRGNSNISQVFLCTKSPTSRLPTFCCEKLLRDKPRWSLVCIPLPITTQKLQKSPKCNWPHSIQNVVHKCLKRKQLWKDSHQVLLGQARERKDPAGGSSGSSSCLEKQYDGWLPLATVSSHERQVFVPGFLHSLLWPAPLTCMLVHMAGMPQPSAS